MLHVAIIVAVLAVASAEVRKLGMSSLRLDSASFLSGDTASVSFTVFGERPNQVSCAWYMQGEKVDSCPEVALTLDDAGQYVSKCKLPPNAFGSHKVECYTTDDAANRITVKSKDFEVIMNTQGGIITNAAPYPHADDDGHTFNPQDGPDTPDEDDYTPSTQGPGNHDFDDDYEATAHPTDSGPGPVPQPGPLPDPGPWVADDDGPPVPAPVPQPNSGPGDHQTNDDIPDAGPAPAPVDPVETDDDWTPPTQGPTSDIAVSLTMSMVISGVSKTSWDKDTSSYNSAWALALVRTITSYYVTQSSIMVSSVKAGDNSDGVDRVIVTGSVNANDPDDTPDSIFQRVKDAVGNGLFTYLLDEEARLINAWDLEASNADSVTKVGGGSNVLLDVITDKEEEKDSNNNKGVTDGEEAEVEESTPPAESSSSSSSNGSSMDSATIGGIAAGSIVALLLVGLAYKMCTKKKAVPEVSIDGMGLAAPSHVSVTMANTRNPMATV